MSKNKMFHYLWMENIGNRTFVDRKYVAIIFKPCVIVKIA